MKNGYLVMDSDFHLMEPDDLWDRYLDDDWKPQAPKFSHNPLFPESTTNKVMMVQGQAIPAYHQHAGAVGTISNLEQRTVASDAHYQLAVKRGFDPETHLAAMDIEGIDVGVLYATRGRQILCADQIEPEYALALCRAYNNWTHDYIQSNPERMKLAAQVPFHDARLAAEEARRVVTELGAVAIVGVPTPVNGHVLHDEFYDPLWAEVERLGIAVGFHPTGASSLKADIGMRFAGHTAFFPISHSARNPMENMLAFASLAMGGVFERFPGLRVGFLESTCGWLPWWLERLDDQWHKYGRGCEVKLSAKPSDYFFRNCYIATDADEEQLCRVIDQLGDERIVVSTDYPHADGIFPEATNTFLGIKGLSAESKRKILWDNCARFYGIETPKRAQA
jgi:predicted TIM-barrel fold metal-dependent hydrolase